MQDYIKILSKPKKYVESQTSTPYNESEKRNINIIKMR